jgi:glycosyltransferase involved in cell wall biosynthesis
MRLIIYAPMIYTGGGKSLLLALIRALQQDPNRWSAVQVILDSRFEDLQAPLPGMKVLASVRPHVMDRLRAERLLQVISDDRDVVVCLANLPPLFSVKGTVIGFIQNAHLLETPTGQAVTFKKRIERWWFKAFEHHCSWYVVQTKSMRDRLLRFSSLNPSAVLTIPFVDSTLVSKSSGQRQSPILWDFGYVSLPWGHKNHRRLIEAFILLAKEGLTPSLVMTVPERMDPDLYQWMKQARETEGVNLTNLEEVEYRSIGEIYQSLGALIFPSLIESFALPLLEAKAYGVPILAPERDYVRDVVSPCQTFDPESPRSMMRAVRRYLEKPEEPESVQPATQFLAELFRLGKSTPGSGKGR